jgi:hypothetical protein
MSKDVIKLPVVLVVLVGSAFNVEIHKNAVQGIDRHWAEIRPFAFSPFSYAGRGEARLDVSRVLAPLDRGQIYCTHGSKRPTAYPERGGVVLIHPRDLCIQQYLGK